jgi:acyl-CoA dehydrogenase
MAVSIDAVALLVYRAAWQHGATEQSILREAVIAKLFSTEAAFDVIDEAVQIFGGLGVVRGITVERVCCAVPGHFGFSMGPVKFSD